MKVLEIFLFCIVCVVVLKVLFSLVSGYEQMLLDDEEDFPYDEQSERKFSHKDDKELSRYDIL